MKVLIEAFSSADFWKLTGSVKLRIYANQSFWTSNGQYVPRGTVGSANTAYLEVACTVLGSTLTIPDFEIDSTVDSLDNIWATYTAELVTDGKRVSFLANFAVNTLEAGDPSLTWGEIILLRNMLAPQSIPESLTRQIAAMITLAVGQLNRSSETNYGVTALTANPLDPAFPIAVGANDPVWLSLLAGTGMLAEIDTAVLVDGRVTIPAVAVAADSKIFHSAMEGVTGALHIENIVPGESFDIVSANFGDNGTVSWALAN